MKVEQMWEIADTQIGLSELASTQELRELCMHCISVAINHPDVEAHFMAEKKKAECDHSHYSFDQHGRICTCGTMMVDFGD